MNFLLVGPFLSKLIMKFDHWEDGDGPNEKILELDGQENWPLLLPLQDMQHDMAVCRKHGEVHIHCQHPKNIMEQVLLVDRGVETWI